MIPRLGKPRDVMRALLALLLLAAFQTALFWLFQFDVPSGNKDIVIYMLGQLSGFAGMAFIFYFGTTKSSADKTQVIREMTEEHPSGTPTDPVHTEEVGTRRDLPEPQFGRAQGGD